MTTDFSTVTEVPGNQVTDEAIQMMATRYHVASQYCEERDVLEVGCGAGQGLGHLSSVASYVVGGDYMGNLVKLAQEHYKSRVGLVQFDAHHLPFKDSSFDTVVSFEALYYFVDADKFMEECHRILRNNGTFLLCTANKNWSGFNSSPYSVGYHSGPELSELLQRHGFDAKIFGAFPVATDSVASKVVSIIRRVAIALHMVPTSMNGKEWLKKLFYGRLTPVPPELKLEPTFASKIVPISANLPTDRYKVIYVIAQAGQ